MKLTAKDAWIYLTEAVMVVLAQTPGVGMVIDYGNRLAMAHKMRDICAQAGDLSQRVAMLEALAATPAAEIEAIAQPRLRGSAQQQQFTLEVLRQISQRVTRKVTSTKRLGTSQLSDDEAFYLDLIPERRPHDYTGQEVPHHPRWILQELIGSGGMGEVWRARHETLPEQEAIKFCHEEAQRAFLQREVNTLKRVQQLPQHPNIVRLKDVNLDRVPYWLAFEYIPGGTLLDLMQQRHLAWGEALHLMTEIGQGVAAAHALGIVHRDLKPANILLTADGVPKVTDFGLGKVLGPTDASTRLGMGTQDYAAPEQAKGQRADPADDVYALGVILWQLSAHTFQSPQYFRQSLEHSRLPKAAQQLIADCLTLPRGQRPPNASVFLQRLGQLPHILDVNVTTIQGEITTKHNEALQAQAALFAKQLKDWKKAAEQSRPHVQPAPHAAPATIQPGQSLAEQWQRIQHLTAELTKIAATFAQERTQEQQRIEQRLTQALKQLGEFRSEPRDEEFEPMKEYQTRLAQEKAQYVAQRQAITDIWQQTKQENLTRIAAAERAALDECRQALARLPAMHYPFQYGGLTDWRYDLNQETLHCQKVIKGLFPLEQIRLTLAAKMAPDHAKRYRTDPGAFQVRGKLALQADPPAIVVAEADLELAGVGRFPAQGRVTLEPDVEAIALKAFTQAKTANTRQAFATFIKDYPTAAQIPEAKALLQRTPISASYVDNCDGTVTDLKTGLMWKRCSEGQTWDGNTCVGEARKMKWNEIMMPGWFGVHKQKPWPAFAGYHDWRVPTKKELRTLVYCSSGKPKAWNDTEKSCEGEYRHPTIDQIAFPNTPSWGFWSGSAYVGGIAWLVNFANGYGYWLNRSRSKPVRLVRAGA